MRTQGWPSAHAYQSYATRDLLQLQSPLTANTVTNTLTKKATVQARSVYGAIDPSIMPVVLLPAKKKSGANEHRSGCRVKLCSMRPMSPTHRVPYPQLTTELMAQASTSPSTSSREREDLEGSLVCHVHSLRRSTHCRRLTKHFKSANRSIPGWETSLGSELWWWVGHKWDGYPLLLTGAPIRPWSGFLHAQGWRRCWSCWPQAGSGPCRCQTCCFSFSERPPRLSSRSVRQKLQPPKADKMWYRYQA